LHRTLDELRRARVTPSTLARTAFEDPRKPRELGELARAYEESLTRLKAIDAAEVLGRATELCVAEGALPAARRVLRPASLELAPLEESFLAACAPHAVPLASDVATAPLTATLEFTQALSEENEVRAVFRRILDEALRCDDVEIVFDDDATFRPLI